MDSYKVLKERIVSYIYKDAVENNDQIISAYTLCSILEKERNKLINFEENNRGLLDAVNSYFHEPIVVKKGLFKKEIKYADRYTKMAWEINDKNMKLSMHGCPGYNDNEDTHYSLFLQKKLGCDEISSPYPRSDMTSEMYETCRDDINNAFSTLEYFTKLYVDNETECGYSQTIITNDVTVRINWNIKSSYDAHKDKCFSYDIMFGDDIDYDDSIEQFLSIYKSAILKNTPIVIDRLNPFFRKLVIDNIKEKEKVMQK